MKNTITKEQLEDLYFDKNLSISDIGKYFGYKGGKVIRPLFDKFGIEIKNT